MSQPILALKKVNVRFGGLNAVTDLDIAIDRGEIFSVIGPNGAGKTTVFNTISGIYEPTSGHVEFNGRSLHRPFTWKVVAACALVGLLTGLAVLLFAADVDAMWRAVIKRNYLDPNTPFSYAVAWRDLQGYLRGDLAIEHRGKRWNIVPADNSRPLATASDEATARAKRDALQSIVTFSAERGGGTLKPAGPDTWDVAFGEQAVPLGHFAGPSFAEREFDTLSRIAAGRRQRTVRMKWGLILGILVGAAGTYSVWHRARRTPEVVALAGIARTFQNIRLFQSMTVLENVLTAQDRHLHAGPIAMALRTPGMRQDEAAAVERARRLLAEMGLADKEAMLAKNLPYGDQRRLEIARALATQPSLILLDEPAAGMNPAESAALTQLIESIRPRGITVLLIEHHMKVVMGISNRIAVLDYGVKIGEGTPEEVRNNPEVIKAYLGSEEVT